jgi:hypothetical protein
VTGSPVCNEYKPKVEVLLGKAGLSEKEERQLQARFHAGITRVVRGESDLLGTLTRTQVMGGAKDLPRVKKIQRSYKLQPLSKFLGKRAPASASVIQWPTWTEGDETREAYWSYVSFLLPFITPQPDDATMCPRRTATSRSTSVRTWGQQGILDGSWKPPVIRRVK